MGRKYRTQFEIGLNELDIIEKALRAQASQIGDKMLNQKIATSEEVDADASEQLNTRMAAIQQVLGNLHNQKIWFRPQKPVPLG